MCGIAGYIVKNSKISIGDALFDMSNAITHRGPDDSGFYIDNFDSNKYQIGLAHRRLSIIDLETGHQPLSNEDGSIYIIFNGEIYNYKELRETLINLGYKFKTLSDTETIVYAYQEYGDKCVEMLHGMFAFSIWDTNRNKLFCARDRFGKKPLFYYQDNNIFAFASEIKSLLEIPYISKEIDYEAIWNYFTYRYVPGPSTLLKNIKKLQTWICWHMV